MPTYLVTASAQGMMRSWPVEAPSGPKAQHAAREAARTEGWGRIMVHSVLPCRPVVDDDPERLIDEEIAERLMANPGPTLTVDEINAAIEDILGTDVPLQAVERDGHIFLDDGISPTVDGDDLSRKELVILCYEWSVYVGHESGTFADFLD